MMLHWHSRVCPTIYHPESAKYQLAPGCYFERLLACIVRGWEPPSYLTTLFLSLPRLRQFFEHRAPRGRPGVEAMLHNAAIRECSSESDHILHPLGAVLKTSDKTRAWALLEIIKDQKTLGEANAQLLNKGLSMIKVRVAMKCTANGILMAPRIAHVSYILPSAMGGHEISCPRDFFPEGSNRYQRREPLLSLVFLVSANAATYENAVAGQDVRVSGVELRFCLLPI